MNKEEDQKEEKRSKGETTKVNKSVSGKYKYLRTSIPSGVIKHLGLKAGDKLNWQLSVDENEKEIIIKVTSSQKP